MNEFVARTSEISELNEMYHSNNFEMAVIYGRRRVGKTSLIKHFIKDKPAIYVQGIEATKELNLRYLSDAIMNFDNPDQNSSGINFDDFKSAFEYVQNIANHSKQKLVFVLDEFPYFAETAPEISSLLQYVIDHIYKEHNNIMLILCGSSMSFMEHQVLGHKSPLYGRRTGQFKIRPFNIFDTKKMLANTKNEDILAYYGITGGIPQYLSFINEDLTVMQNIKRMFLRENAPLQDETNILLQEELRKPATYYSILVAIANGKTKSNQISQAIGFDNPSKLSPYLAKLIELDIIEHKAPIFEKGMRKAIYVFKDTMFNFWFKFISGHQDQIALNRIDGILKLIEKEMPRFLGPIFEKACIDWLWKNHDLPIEPKEIKNWWGYNPVLKRQDEIDIVATNFEDTEAVVAECKWRNANKLNVEMLKTLILRAQLLPKTKKHYFYFFVKEANSDFIKRAKLSEIKVISYNDLFN